jgi:hypothetical protein
MFGNDSNKSIHDEIRKLILVIFGTIESRTFCLLICFQKTYKIYKTVILPVLYGCKIWSLTLREEHSRRVFENRVLRILGPKENV